MAVDYIDQGPGLARQRIRQGAVGLVLTDVNIESIAAGTRDAVFPETRRRLMA
jgi:hypothetical protein